MTENNSISMKTVVETYLIEETVELIYDNEKLGQWNSMVKELGLEGQTTIVKEDKSPIPFQHMKTTLVRTFETLCPCKVDVKTYNKTPIPVEILSLVSLSVKEGYFNRIEIWYDDKAPDPACIGVKGLYYAYTGSGWDKRHEFVKENEWNEFKANSAVVHHGFNPTDLYLIGRWADVKMPLEELTEKAKIIYTATQKDQFNKQILDAKRGLEDLEIRANDYFGFTNNTGGLSLELGF